MNLYLISQTVNDDWDTYDSAVVAAIDAESAKRIHPSESSAETCSWCKVKDVQVKLIGYAIPDTDQGVVLASYNAG